MKRLKKVLKIISLIVVILLTTILILLHRFFEPASDEKIRQELSEGPTSPYISKQSFGDHEYRVIAMQQELDSALPTLIFVHGSPGSPLDYKRYLNDSLINEKANLITYERIGYNQKDLGKPLGTLESETDILHNVIKDIPEENIILIGYSYGGPVILASNKNYKYKISLASAVVGEYEPMFGLLKFYCWKLTRPLVPAMLRAAAIEKYAHRNDLPNYKDKWNTSPTKIVNIHGDKDFIVPFKNSKFLEDTIDSDKFKMVTIEGGGHDLIWSDFDLIKAELLKTLD